MSFMKKQTARIFSGLLAAAMIITSAPQSILTVDATEITPLQSVDATDVDTAGTDISKEAVIGDTDTETEPDTPTSTAPLPEDTLQENTSPEDSADPKSPVNEMPDAELAAEDSTPDTDAPANGDSTVFTVTFNLCGFGDSTKKSVPAGSKLVESDMPNPEVEGFFLEGWFKDEWWTEPWIFESDTVTEDLTLYAAWSKNCTVTFDLRGHGIPEGSDGKIVKKDIHSGYPLTKTDDLIPSETGYHFVNWYKDEDFTQVWDFNEDVVADDMTLYAKWVKLEDGQCVVTFNLSGHGTDSFQYIQSGNPIEKPEDPADIGYRFVNWYKDAEFNTAWDFTTDTVTADLTLYAKWEEFFYTVTFNLSGQGEPITKQVQEGALITLTPDLTPTADNFAFDGWYKDAEFRNIWDFEQDTVMANTELFAKWSPTYTVTFDLDGKGDNIVKTAIRAGSLIEKTPDLTPVADGWIFINWYKEPDLKNIWNFNTDTVNDNITLYAKWIESEANKALVTFDLGEHDIQPIDPQYVAFGQKIKRPKDPADEGYLFSDWYADAGYQEKWDFDNDTVEEGTASITLHAKWCQPDALHVQAPAPTLYTGKAVKPAISVYYGSEEEQILLKAGKDYKITYKNNINTNAYVQQQATGAKAWAEEDTLSGGSSTTGEYAVGGFNPELPYIFIEGKGNYEGNFYLNFEIQQVHISDENNNPASGITFKCNDQMPLGTPKKDQQTITTLKYKTALKEGIDYETSITGATATGSVISKNDPIFIKDGEGNGGGTCTLTITGKGNYTGTINQTIIVGKNDTLMKNVKVSLGGKCKSKPISSAGEDGVTLIPAWQETVLEEKTDRDGETIYDRNGDPVMVNKTYYYQYIDGNWVTPSDLDYEDDNGKIIKGKLDKSNAFTVKSGKTWLKYGVDYDIEYRNNTSAGTATMIIKGMGSYVGSVSVNFKITGGGGKAFSAGTITFSSDEDGNGWASKMSYTGAPLTQSVTLETKKRTKVYECGYENGDEEEYEYEYKYYEDGEWLTDTITKTRRHRHNRNCEYHVEIEHVFDPEEYTVTYVNNIKCGTATATFTANPGSGYSGSFKKTFRIVGVDMARYVTFECAGDELAPNIWEDEVSTGRRDEDGEIIYKTVEKISATRTLNSSQPYAKGGATLNFSLYREGDEENVLVPNRDYTIKYSSNKSITPYKRILLNKWKEEDDWNDNGVVTKWHWEYEYDEVPNPAKMGTLTITGKGNYTGKIIIKYQIIQGSLNMDDVIIDVAHSEYNAQTKEYKPKVTVRTERDGTFSPKDYTVEYVNNKKEQVAKWLSLEANAAAAEAPYVKLTFKKSNNYDNLSADENGNFTAPEPLLADMEFFQNKLTAKNTYIVIDNEKELVYTGAQVTNVTARVYYGDAQAVKAAKKANVTNNRILTRPKDTGGLYGLKRLTGAEMNEDGTYSDGDYTLTYGPNNAIGRNKGSLTVIGCSGFGGSSTNITGYGGSVTQKFNINKSPVSYQVTEPIEPED